MLNPNAMLKARVQDGQVLHVDVEFVALAHEIKQSVVPFGRMDAKLVTDDA
jgi:hypothetical protein